MEPLDKFKIRLGKTYSSLYDDDAIATADLTSISIEVDAIFGLRYKMPLISVSGQNLRDSMIVTLTEELAWARSGANKIPEHVKERCVDTRKRLTAVSTGELKLPAETASTVSVDSSTLVECDEPQFTAQKLKGF